MPSSRPPQFCPEYEGLEVNSALEGLQVISVPEGLEVSSTFYHGPGWLNSVARQHLAAD